MGFEALRGRIKRPRLTVRVNLDATLAEEIARTHQRWKAAVEEEKAGGGGLTDSSPQLAQELIDLRRQWREAGTEFTFEALPGAKYDALATEHPPTEEQLAEYREILKTFPFADAPEVNPDTLGPILIARCLVAIDGEPVEWSDEDGQALWNEVHDGARADLVEAAWAVNGGRSELPTFGTGTGTTPSSGPGSIMQFLEESPSPSLKAGS